MDFTKESVHLRFRQRIRSFHIEGILGGQYEKGFFIERVSPITVTVSSPMASKGRSASSGLPG